MPAPSPHIAAHPTTVQQRAADLHERARLGGIFYVLSWALVVGFSDGWDTYRVASLLIGAVFVGLMVARFVVRRGFLKQRQPAEASMRRQWAVLLFTGLVWGACSGWALVDPVFAGARALNLIATSSLAMAFAQIFAVDRRMALYGTATVFLPMLAVAWLDIDAGIGMVLVLNGVYLVAVIGRSHREYESRLDLDAALRIERDRFAEQSRTDPLTRLANRGKFQHELVDAVMEAGATGMPLSLLLADLDHFKAINDRLGHATGDRVLIAAASLLADAFPDARAVARIGGEEFAIVGAGCEPAEFAARAEAARLKIAFAEIDTGHDLPTPVTISLGLAVYDPFQHADSDALYAAADEALYCAKANGRNRLELA